jgi:hypothetical protein
LDEQAKLLDCDDVIREQLALCEEMLETVLARRAEIDKQSMELTAQANALRATRGRYRRALGLPLEDKKDDQDAEGAKESESDGT